MSAEFVVLGCLQETRDTLRHLARLGIRPDHVVGLPREEAERQKVTNFVHMEEVARELDVRYSEVRTYPMREDEDIEIIRQLSPTVLAVVGWQRLVPAQALAAVRIGALGFHGSCNILPWGRGRSPINWSIIEGRDRFALHMFLLTPGIDDGPILGIQLYDINEWDTCRSVYYKTSLAQAELMARHLPRLTEGRPPGLEQIGPEFYYPKRTPDDGRIDWTTDADRICRLVRAVTWPYPGAFTHAGEQRVMIWSAQPFSRDFFADTQPGKVCFIAENSTGEFVVRCADSTVLVTRSEGAEHLRVGTELR